MNDNRGEEESNDNNERDSNTANTRGKRHCKQMRRKMKGGQEGGSRGKNSRRKGNKGALTWNPVYGSKRSQDPNSSNGRQVDVPNIQDVLKGPVSEGHRREENASKSGGKAEMEGSSG
jgi:hypothetical protein